MSKPTRQQRLNWAIYRLCEKFEPTPEELGATVAGVCYSMGGRPKKSRIMKGAGELKEIISRAARRQQKKKATLVSATGPVN